ncbi:hypothetical protein WH47_07575, partial [Habropoda laboriosa]
GWEILSHPLYSPDIAPSDYHLFYAQHGMTLPKRWEKVVEREGDLTY